MLQPDWDLNAENKQFVCRKCFPNFNLCVRPLRPINSILIRVGGRNDVGPGLDWNRCAESDPDSLFPCPTVRCRLHVGNASLTVP